MQKTAASRMQLHAPKSKCPLVYSSLSQLAQRFLSGMKQQCTYLISKFSGVKNLISEYKRMILLCSLLTDDQNHTTV